MTTNTKNPGSSFISFKWIHKYIFAALLFLSWIIFFDKYNLVNQHKLSQTVKKLKTEKETYLQKLQMAKEEKEELELNKERYAREKYFMHKPNENVFKIDR